MRRTPLAVIVLAVVSVLLIAGCGGNPQNNDATSATSNSTSASSSETVSSTVKIGGEEISCEDLFSSVTENEFAADQYIGKPIEAIATVSSVEKDAFSIDYGEGIYSICKNGHISTHVGGYCFMNVEIGDDTSVAASLKKGDQIKVSGTLSGFDTIGAWQNDGTPQDLLFIGLLCSENSTVPYGDIKVEKL